MRKIQSPRTFVLLGCPETSTLLLAQNTSSGSLPARTMPSKVRLISWARGLKSTQNRGSTPMITPPLCMVSTPQNCMKHPLHTRTRLHLFGMKHCENIMFWVKSAILGGPPVALESGISSQFLFSMAPMGVNGHKNH